MVNKDAFRKPQVGLRMYWPEALLLTLAWIVPIVAWLVSRGGLMLSRSGSLMVFFAAIAEFVMLHRANKKHLLNAQRVRAGQAPLGFSNAATIVGWLALISALVGTVLWGYGDLLKTR